MGFHLWLLNDSVDPPIYLHVPAVLDTGAESQLHLPRRDAEKLKLVKDRATSGSATDAGGHTEDLVAYRPIQVFVPMLDKPNGQLSFYEPGWLQPTTWQNVVGSYLEQSNASRAADHAIKSAGQEVLHRVSDKSNAWVETSPARHPHDDPKATQHALLGLPALAMLGLHLDWETGAIRTVRLRTIRRAGDTD